MLVQSHIIKYMWDVIYICVCVMFCAYAAFQSQENKMFLLLFFVQYANFYAYKIIEK